MNAMRIDGKWSVNVYQLWRLETGVMTGDECKLYQNDWWQRHKDWQNAVICSSMIIFNILIVQSAISAVLCDQTRPWSWDDQYLNCWQCCDNVFYQLRSHWSQVTSISNMRHLITTIMRNILCEANHSDWLNNFNLSFQLQSHIFLDIMFWVRIKSDWFCTKSGILKCAAVAVTWSSISVSLSLSGWDRICLRYEWRGLVLTLSLMTR